ncbi:hypothetical protein [Bradyrhizobium sp. SZCCHNRI1029]|uniref:hypothetical protein n=1 Tax=Bradyrhizobium sp. SZCCHNRI1029 TaxID=3057278 RepID=UPI0029168953|nr:hypothetical protein [Bradyrhizobium sp. SZCCHNRI1029]
MDFDDLIVERPATAGAPAAPPDRYFYEGNVMLAYAMHLLRTEPVRKVLIHPDGQHARQVDFPGWLEKHGFRRGATARMPFAGTFEDAEGRRQDVKNTASAPLGGGRCAENLPRTMKPSLGLILGLLDRKSRNVRVFVRFSCSVEKPRMD